MTLTRGLKNLLVILLISHSLNGSAQSDTAKNGAAPKKAASYSGYTVDGRTSASVLAAKRSHSVSKEDETGLAVYSGLIAIGLIIFFVHTLSKKK